MGYERISIILLRAPGHPYTQTVSEVARVLCIDA